MTRSYGMVIDGREATAADGATIEVRNPANVDEIVGRVPKGGRVDVKRAVAAAVKAMQESWWPSVYEWRRRAAIITKFVSLVGRHKQELAELLTREQGKILSESIGEIEILLSTFEFYAGYTGKIAGEVQYLRSGDAVFKVETRKEPHGLCAAILPFNFPVSLYAWKVAPALIAGNAMLIKPASSTPLVDTALTLLLQEAGVPPGIVSVVTGPSSEVGDEILRNQDIRRIAFTGSTEVGRVVASQAGDSLKHATLELGGSDATIVANDADLDVAARTVVHDGRFRNCGQSCVSVKRVFVFEEVYEEFVEQVEHYARRLRVGNGLNEGIDMGPLNNASTRDSVENLLGDAVGRGAKTLTGGGRLDKGDYAKGYFFAPTVLVDVPEDAAIWREECFGPVLPMMKVRDLEESIQRANNTRFGLGATLWSHDDRKVETFVEKIESGMVWINCRPTTFPETPFGGVKDSGVGRELGEEGLDEYLETKSIRKHVGKPRVA